jgi:hypothetical protein
MYGKRYPLQRPRPYFEALKTLLHRVGGGYSETLHCEPR